MNDTQPTGLQLAVALLAQIGDDDSDRAIAAVHAAMDLGQPGELPDGLQLACDMLGHIPHAAFDPQVEQAQDAIRAEHAQRVTMQHHAADLAQRVADLEAERDELRAQLTASEASDAESIRMYRATRAKYEDLLVALHGIGTALGIPEGERSPYSITCGTLERVNQLAEIEAQEPTCWAVIDPTGGSSVEYTAAWKEACHEHIGDMISGADMPEAASFVVRPLYAKPVPAQAALADARREGAEQMQAQCLACCDMLEDAAWAQYEPALGGNRDPLHQGRSDGAAEVREAICALPLPTGERQAVRHVGNSRFESWFSMQPWSAKPNKQHCRDSYAAGMADGNG